MIERLIVPGGDSDLRALAQLLVDAVESGAAVSFLAPLTLERAEDWGRRAIAAFHSGAIFLVARDGEGIVGTVQLHPAWAPNQPHRAEIAKLLVHLGRLSEAKRHMGSPARAIRGVLIKSKSGSYAQTLL
jgi:acetyltransferase